MKVLKKQYNSKMCIICGMNNEAGLKAPFYEMENNTVVTIVTFRQIHQNPEAPSYYSGQCLRPFPAPHEKYRESLSP